MGALICSVKRTLSKVVELRYFDSLSIEETAEALEWVHSSVDGQRQGRTATDRITILR